MGEGRWYCSREKYLKKRGRKKDVKENEGKTRDLLIISPLI